MCESRHSTEESLASLWTGVRRILLSSMWERKRKKKGEKKNMALDFNRKSKPFTVSIRWEDIDRVDSSK